MQISCCLPTLHPYRTEQTAKWFLEAVESAKKFDEVLITVEGKYSEEDLKKFKNVTVIKISESPTPREERVSGGEVYNLAASCAQFDWITFLADDDKYNPEHVEIVMDEMKRMEKIEFDILYFPYYCIHGDKIGIFNPTRPFTMEQLLGCNFISNAAFTKRSVFEELGKRRPNCVDDWDFWIRAKKAGKYFAFCDLPIYYQRFYEDSLFMRQKKVWGDTKIKEQNKRTAYENG